MSIWQHSDILSRKGVRLRPGSDVSDTKFEMLLIAIGIYKVSFSVRRVFKCIPTSSITTLAAPGLVHLPVGILQLEKDKNISENSRAQYVGTSYTPP